MAHSYLRQSTASQGRKIGPLVSDTDFKSPIGSSIPNTSIKLSKNGVSAVDKNVGGGGTTPDSGSGHLLTFVAADTDTVGELVLSVVHSGVALYSKTYWVLEEAVYDRMFAAGAAGMPTATEIAVAMAGLTTTGNSNPGTMGEQWVTKINSVQSRTNNLPVDTAASLNSIASKVNSLPVNPAAQTDIPSTADIATAVVNKDAGGTGAGTVGAYLIAASSSGDPWATVLGSYPAGTAGNIFSTRLDAAVSSRLGSVPAIIAALKADTEWKTLYAMATGDYSIAYPPVGSAGTATLTLKDHDGVLTRVTYALSIDANGRITTRNATPT